MTTSRIITLGYRKYTVPAHWDLADVRNFIGMAAELRELDYHYNDGEHYHYTQADNLVVSSSTMDVHSNRKAAETAARIASMNKEEK